jgi:pyruvate kinase
MCECLRRFAGLWPLFDTIGPGYEQACWKAIGKSHWEAGREFSLFLSPVEAIRRGYLSIIPDLYKEISAGTGDIQDDGSILAFGGGAGQRVLMCRVLVGGELGEKKGVNRKRDAVLSVPTLTDKDICEHKMGHRTPRVII